MTLSFQQQPPALLDWMQRKQQQQPAYGGIQQGVLGQGIQQQGHLDTQPSSFSGQQDVLGQMQPRQLFGQQSVLCRQQFGQQLGTTPIGITVVPVQQYVAPVRRLVVVNAPIVYETIVHRVVEEVNPVVHRDIYQITCIQCVKPVYEHVVEARIYREPVFATSSGISAFPTSGGAPFEQHPQQQFGSSLMDIDVQQGGSRHVEVAQTAHADTLVLDQQQAELIAQRSDAEKHVAELKLMTSGDRDWWFEVPDVIARLLQQDNKESDYDAAASLVIDVLAMRLIADGLGHNCNVLEQLAATDAARLMFIKAHGAKFSRRTVIATAMNAALEQLKPMDKKFIHIFSPETSELHSFAAPRGDVSYLIQPVTATV